MHWLDCHDVKWQLDCHFTGPNLTKMWAVPAKLWLLKVLSWNCACASPRSPPRKGSLWVIFTVTDDVTWSHMCQCLVKEAGAMQGGIWVPTGGQKVRFHVIFPIKCDFMTSFMTSQGHWWCHFVLNNLNMMQHPCHFKNGQKLLTWSAAGQFSWRVAEKGKNGHMPKDTNAVKEFLGVPCDAVLHMHLRHLLASAHRCSLVSAQWRMCVHAHAWFMTVPSLASVYTHHDMMCLFMSLNTFFIRNLTWTFSFQWIT